MIIFSGLLLAMSVFAMTGSAEGRRASAPKDTTYELLRIDSHIAGLKLGLLHAGQAGKGNTIPVLFIHGSSFPSALAAGFRMGGESWMDDLAAAGYDVYAMDFLGYGHSDRYPVMKEGLERGTPCGRAVEVYKDVDLAVDYILHRTGAKKVFLIGHSWGCTVACLYAARFSGKLEKLVLFAPITIRQDTASPEAINTAYECLTPEQRVRAMRSGTPRGEICRLEPEIFGSWQQQWLKSDPLTDGRGTAPINNGGIAPAMIRRTDSVCFPSGPSADLEDLAHGKSYYVPSEITTPTLIIRGEWDGYPDNSDAERLFRELKNSPGKRYIVVEKGTHVMHLEKSRHQLYREVQSFLNEPVINNPQHMVAVIFEVRPYDEARKQEYLDIAKSLRPQLDLIDGFVSIERFQSLTDPGKILSLSFWRDEDAVKQWRTAEDHRVAQQKGRNGVFSDYRLRVVSVIRDYGMFDRAQVPEDIRKK